MGLNLALWVSMIGNLQKGQRKLLLLPYSRESTCKSAIVRLRSKEELIWRKLWTKKLMKLKKGRSHFQTLKLQIYLLTPNLSTSCLQHLHLCFNCFKAMAAGPTISTISTPSTTTGNLTIASTTAEIIIILFRAKEGTHCNRSSRSNLPTTGSQGLWRCKDLLTLVEARSNLWIGIKVMVSRCPLLLWWVSLCSTNQLACNNQLDQWMLHNNRCSTSQWMCCHSSTRLRFMEWWAPKSLLQGMTLRSERWWVT